MRMRGAHRIGPGRVDPRVNCKCRSVDRSITFDNLSFVADSNQIGDLDETEIQSKWINPKRIRKFRIARGYVTGYALIKPEFGEHPKTCGEPLLAMLPLIGHIRKYRRVGQVRIHLLGCRICSFDPLMRV